MITTISTTVSTDAIASIDDLGYAIAARGIHAEPATLLQLADTARDLGVDDLLVDLMVDDDEPAAARVRAFARVSTRVASVLRDGDGLALAC
jgi:hypothetical protein